MSASDGPVAALEWRHIMLDLGGFRLDDVSIRLEPGEWLALLGPTGAGKTLILELAAGFIRPTSGRVLAAGVDLGAVPPERRRIGYVPQDDLLFPHLDARENLLFGAKRAGEKGPRLDERMRIVADALGILHLVERSRAIQGVSGGEAQRIAVGRALLTPSTSLLLDECTSALDEETRDVIGDFLRRWRQEQELAVVQVTHDVHEAQRLADRVVRVDRGRVVTRPPKPRSLERRFRARSLSDDALAG